MHDTAALHERLNQARSTGGRAIFEFFDELEKTPEDPTVVWFLVEVLERLTEADAVVTPMSVINQLRKRGKADILPRVKAARPKMPHLMGGMRDYRNYVDYVIDLLEVPASGRCLCQVYAKHGAHNGEAGLVTESSRVDDKIYAVFYRVRCEACGRRWQVAELDADILSRMRYSWDPLPSEP